MSLTIQYQGAHDYMGKDDFRRWAKVLRAKGQDKSARKLEDLAAAWMIMEAMVRPWHANGPEYPLDNLIRDMEKVDRGNYLLCQADESTRAMDDEKPLVCDDAQCPWNCHKPEKDSP